MSERCPMCKTGLLLYEWHGGILRLVCRNLACRAEFRPDYTLAKAPVSSGNDKAGVKSNETNAQEGTKC